MAKYIQGVSVGEIFDKVMDCGIDDSAENRLFIEQGLEIFLGQEFGSGEFLEELLALADWTMYEQDCILRAVEEFEGQRVYSVGAKLVALVEAAKERAAKAVEREKSTSKDKDSGMEIG